MSHKDVLRQLFPIELGGVFEDDIALEGKQLDDAMSRAESLLGEIFADIANETIMDYERVYGLTPVDTDTLQVRRDRVVAKMRARGALSRPYYVMLAATMGYDITIEQLAPNAETYGPESIFIWRIVAHDTPTYYFRAGESEAGERLLDWLDDNALEGMFEDLKPAHTQLIWAYD